MLEASFCHVILVRAQEKKSRAIHLKLHSDLACRLQLLSHCDSVASLCHFYKRSTRLTVKAHHFTVDIRKFYFNVFSSHTFLPMEPSTTMYKNINESSSFYNPFLTITCTHFPSLHCLSTSLTP